MICLKFLILEPRGSCTVASSINGRLSASIMWFFFLCMKSIQLLNFVYSLFCFVLSYVVPTLSVVESS
jgi:hypothetical protein